MNCNLAASYRNSYTGKDKSILDRNDPAQKRFITDTPFPYLPCSCRILGITIHTRADVDPVQIGDDLGRHIIIAHSLNYPFVKRCVSLFWGSFGTESWFSSATPSAHSCPSPFSFHLKYGVELMDEHVHLFRFSVEQIRMYGKDTVNVCQQNFALGCILRRQYIIPKFFSRSNGCWKSALRFLNTLAA